MINPSEIRLNTSSAICGGLFQISVRFGSKTQPKLLINTTGYGRLCAHLRVYERKNKKKFSESHRRYFKNSRKLLLKRFDDLNDEQKQQVNIMLYTSPNLCTAHFYKEDFLKILYCQDRQSARKAMSDWINSAYDCGIPRFVKCVKIMQNWLTGILDSFTTPLTNGFIEGCNNKIKVLKRNAYGYRDFNRFRNRILHMFSLKSAKNKSKPPVQRVVCSRDISPCYRPASQDAGFHFVQAYCLCLFRHPLKGVCITRHP